jgi:hypothetical protein
LRFLHNWIDRYQPLSACKCETYTNEAAEAAETKRFKWQPGRSTVGLHDVWGSIDSEQAQANTKGIQSGTGFGAAEKLETDSESYRFEPESI